MRYLRALAVGFVITVALCSFSGCNVEETEVTDTEEITETQKETQKKPGSTSTASKYDDEKPENPAQLPKYNGKDFTHADIYLGQQSEMRISADTNEDEYKAYLKDLESCGFTEYATNKLGDNLFATYIDNEHILNVMFIPAFKQTRVIIDKRSIFSLPGLEEENNYEDSSEPALILLSDDKISWPGRMGYVYQLADGSFFIIDGGWSDNTPSLSAAPLLMAVLEEYAPDPENIKISAWLITHQHTDHLGAMYDIINSKEYRSKISVDKIIYNMPSQLDLSTQDSNGKTLATTGRKMTACIANLQPKDVIKAHPGQVFYIKDLTLTIYHSHDLLLYAPIASSDRFLITSISTHNDTSVVSKVEFQGKTTLYMGDSSAQANSNVLAPVFGSALNADILQVAHHGYADTQANKVYTHLSPEIVFWPVRRGHYDGKNPDGSIYYESGGAYTGVASVGLNSSLFKEGIKHVFFQNDVCVVIDNFETWEHYEWDALPNE